MLLRGSRPQRIVACNQNACTFSCILQNTLSSNSVNKSMSSRRLRHSSSEPKNGVPIERHHDPKLKLKSNPALKTVHWDELEEWQKDNEYILYGYRR